MFNALELLMLLLAFGVMAAGLARRRPLPGRKQKTAQRSDWIHWAAVVFGQKRLMDRPVVAAAHLCLVYGFALFVLIVLLAQLPLVLPGQAAGIVSLLLDITGMLMLASTLFLFLRRVGRMRNRADQRPPKRTLLPLVFLFAILLSGLCAEGARLNLIPSARGWAAPAGSLFSMVLPNSPGFMQGMLRAHFFFFVVFVATLPFTFMRHMASTTSHLLHREKGTESLPTACDLENGPLGAATVLDLSGHQLREIEACVSCGRCDEQCPAQRSGKPLSPRTIMGKFVDQMAVCSSTGDFSCSEKLPRLADVIGKEEVWACTTCMACVTHCPVYIRPLDKIIELRRQQVLQQGRLPSEAVGMIRNLELFGDVNGRGAAHRGDWALNRNVPRVPASSNPPDVLLWPGCSGAFHPAYQNTTRDLVKLLQAGGLNFAILAQEESCCGDPARKLGDEALFLSLARRNIQRFKAHHISKIVTPCPHCFNTLAKEYSALGCDVEVVPALSMVEEFLRTERITLKYPFSKRLAVHDPCYLGRYNGIYEPLRNVCRSVPGTDLCELSSTKERGLCCGGGGGRMWLHETSGENINVMRAREVVASGADAVVTACPYCLTMLEDGVKTVVEDAPPQVIDIISLVAEALG